MKLSQLKNILTFDTDFADKDVDITFYTELNDILPKYADELNVVSISTTHIVCDFYDFLMRHAEEIISYIKANYKPQWVEYYTNGFETKDIEIIAMFMERELGDFLIGE